MLVLFVRFGASLNADDRPNILWLSAEDISTHFGCYGDPHAITPNVDKVAQQGIVYKYAFTTAGVCAPSRSAIISSMYQTSIGTQHMRCNATLPGHIKPFPVYLREAGYYCTNNSKTDYQFSAPKNTWDSGKGHWKNAPKGKPFFSVFNFGGCHESGIASGGKYKSVTKVLGAEQRQDPKKLSTLPPYYPDTPVVREDWKRNYELITAFDHWVGEHLDALEKAGLSEKTIVFIWSDHGVGLPRAKRWLYDSGTRVPLVVRIPEAFRKVSKTSSSHLPAAGSVSEELVSGLDFGPTVLNLAGVKLPEFQQGRPFLATNISTEKVVPRDYVYAARDRMDERYDIIRMVRDQRFKYIRNYEPLKTYFQYMNTPEKGATMSEIRRIQKAGWASEGVQRFLEKAKSVEELYDTHADPHEMKNLAADPAHALTLKKMREAHLNWVSDTRDLGLIPEGILAAREKTFGNRFDILAKSGDLADRLRAIAPEASNGEKAMPILVKGMEDPDAAVRYWGATGLGNIGTPAKQHAGLMEASLKDESPTVRVAAARALARMGMPDKALPVLTEVLDKGEQWERLAAAIVLDEMDKDALPAIDALKAALKPRKKLYAGGKYVVRVVNRAINELEGTSNKVK